MDWITAELLQNIPGNSRKKLRILIFLFLDRRERCSTERQRGFPVDHQFQIYMVVGKSHEVAGCEDSLEFLLKEGGVVSSQAEADERSEVSDHSIADFFVQLVEVLVSKDQSYSVLPEF